MMRMHGGERALDTGAATGFFHAFGQDPAWTAPDAEQAAALSASIAALVAHQIGIGRRGEQASANPAALTFLGQFIDHDITAMRGEATLETVPFGVDARAMTNGRVPVFDLDSLYRGRALYHENGASLRVVRDGDGLWDFIRLPNPDRPDELNAVIGDGRNDENLVIAQIHLLFVRYHNRLVDAFLTQGDSPPKALEKAQKEVRHSYQRIVYHDYLPAIIDSALLARLKRDNPMEALIRDHAGRGGLNLPAEFAFAAFRFGHSQVRNGYILHQKADGTPVARRTFASDAFDSLRGGQRINRDNFVDWRFFTPLPQTEPEPRMNRAMAIDAFLTDSLAVLTRQSLPASSQAEAAINRNLADRNIRRGYQLALRSGQAIARALGEAPLTGAEANFTRDVFDQPLPDDHPLFQDTPLWTYTLIEARPPLGIVLEPGKLRGVGGTIVGGTLLALLALDPQSFLNDPEAEPLRDLPFTLGHLVKLVGADRVPLIP